MIPGACVRKHREQGQVEQAEAPDVTLTLKRKVRYRSGKSQSSQRLMCQAGSRQCIKYSLLAGSASTSVPGSVAANHPSRETFWTRGSLMTSASKL